MDNYYSELRKINVSKWVEQKPKKTKDGREVKLNYLSWANAWDQLKSVYPDANYTVYENADGWNYHTDGRTAWVKVGVTVCGIEHIETLPVYDLRFNSVPLESVTSDHVNTAIMRCLTKCIGRHGLGIGLYAGEDLIDDEPTLTKAKNDDDLPFYFSDEKKSDEALYACTACGQQISYAEHKYSTERMGKDLCRSCQRSVKANG